MIARLEAVDPHGAADEITKEYIEVTVAEALDVYRRGLSGTGGPEPVRLPHDIGTTKVNRPMLDDRADLPPIRGVPRPEAEPSSG